MVVADSGARPSTNFENNGTPVGDVSSIGGRRLSRLIATYTIPVTGSARASFENVTSMRGASARAWGAAVTCVTTDAPATDTSRTHAKRTKERIMLIVSHGTARSPSCWAIHPRDRRGNG